MTAMPHGPVSLGRAEQSQLILVDIQERLAAAMPEATIERLTAVARLLSYGAGQLGIPLHVTEQYPQGLGSTLPAIRETLPAALAAVSKTCFSVAGLRDVQMALASEPERREVYLLGMEAHICVFQSAIDLRDLGYLVRVVEDGVCSRRSEDSDSALARLRQAGIELLTSEAVVFEWLRDARHPAFKAITPWLR